MAQGTLKVHSENILPIIKKWLYSDKDIFLRELVSNSSDAIYKLKFLHKEQSELPLEIRITVDKEKKTITIKDTGVGMTHDEVEKYIAQVAFSGAEEFLEKYKSEKEQIIGHFGLGFFSSFMVSNKVVIETLSFQENAKPVRWESDGSSTYEIEEGSKNERGTEITLFIDENSLEYLEVNKLEELLKRYSSYLAYPIYLNDKQVNHKDPLWLKNPSDCTDKEYIDFYKELYPFEPEPLFWVHINVDYPFHVKGILYFPKINKRFDFQKSSIKLFCSRVFVSDDCKDLLPDYLMILRGAIDSPDIPLNVSRSYLQMDKTVRSLGQHISKKVTQKLSNLYTTDREKFIQHWKDLEMIIKLGILQDEKFYERVKDFLIFKTTSGSHLTIDEYINQNKDKAKDTIYYTSEEKSEPEFIQLYKEKGIDVIYTHPLIDPPLMNHIEGKLEGVSFKRIDASIGDDLIDKEKEKTLLDSEGKSEAANIADFIRSSLSEKELEVEAKSLSSSSVPALFVIDENARRLRDFMMAQSEDAAHLPQKKSFVVNTNSPLIQKAYSIKTKHPEVAKELVQRVYDLTALSQKELDISKLPNVISENTKLLEKMAELI